MLRTDGSAGFDRSTQTRMAVVTRKPSKKPEVAILLCTMQGSEYLREQLDSILHQTHDNWTVWASDDGSDDGTHAILGQYQSQLSKSRLAICPGPSDGYVANFLSLACNDSITADYYAYADQDDIWEKDKLAWALAWLQTIPAEIPALYCARTRNVDANNRYLGLSTLFARAPGFSNALVQNIGGGNTMVFNNAARDLLRNAGPKAQVVAHDWWTYLLVSGCGGMVFYDTRPTVRYRQHNGNLVGTNTSWAGRMRRAWLLLHGRFRNWNGINVAALQTVRQHLTPENQCTLDLFSKARNSGFFARLEGLAESGIYRQTRLGNLGLVAAAILKKI